MSSTSTQDAPTAAAPRRVLMLLSNPAVSPVTGWPIGFWWAELSHPYQAFVEAGCEVTIASPEGGALQADAWSDPRDESGYSADDLLSLGFLSSPRHMALVERSVALSDLDLADFDAVFLVGGQGPMVTFRGDDRVRSLVEEAYARGLQTALVCHATCVLLDARDEQGRSLVAGKAWTGFANSEEDAADAFVGQAIQPFRIEDEARAMPDSGFCVGPAFQPFALRDGHLVTGQQQHSGRAAAELVLEAWSEGA